MERAAQVRPGFVTAALRRRRGTVALGAVVGLLLGAGAALAIPVTYTSQASLFLNPVAGNPYQPDIGTARSDQLVALQTEASLVATPEVATLATSLSPVALPDAAERQVQVSSPSNSQVLRVSYEAGRPEVARAGAQSFADGYLEYRRLQAEAANQAAAQQLQQQLDATTTVMEQTAASLSIATTDSSIALLLQQQLQIYSSQLAQLNLQLTQVQTAVQSTGEVISPATAADQPSGLPLWLVVAGGLAAGLGLAVLYVLAREHGDERIRDAQELTALGIGHPLATLPTDRAALDLRSGSPEGYRVLLAMIANRQSDSSAVIHVLGMDGSGAASTAAAGLAAAAHRLGRRTLVGCARMPDHWGGAQVIGTDQILERPLSDVQRSPVFLRLGADAASIEKEALSPRLQQSLVRARQSWDLVVLDGGTGSSAVGWRFAELADLTLVVGELGRDEFPAMLDLVETLRQSGVDALAVVAATPPARGEAVRWRAVPARAIRPGATASARPDATEARDSTVAHTARRPSMRDLLSKQQTRR